MRLEIGNILISDIQFADATKVENSVLYISKEEMIKTIATDDRIVSVDLDIVRPGESVRVTPVKDVIEPRVKVSGNRGIFPGFLSSVEQVGSGRTRS